MGGKSSSKPKAAEPTPAVPNETMAQEAAARALEARGNITGAQAAEDEMEEKRHGSMQRTLGASEKPRKHKRDPGSMMGATNPMQQSAVLTG